MHSTLPPRWMRLMFSVTLFMSALTGFAQMPIFKRYYIADVPGLGWLAQFYVTYFLHYISAIVFIALATFIIVDFLLTRRRTLRMTASGRIRGVLLLLILTTGILLVFRNLPGYRFEPEVVVALDFSHLGLVVLFLAVSLISKTMKKQWVRIKNE